jgi:DNA-binding transcriptional LysR family regulator
VEAEPYSENNDPAWVRQRVYQIVIVRQELNVIDLAEIEGFLQAAELRSFTRAARAVGLTQPGLSRQIQKLERALGVVLFLRTRDGLALTAAGESYRAYAEDIVARHRQFLDELHGTTTSLRGELRIAASTTPAEFLVAELIDEFTAAHPSVEAIVFTADSERVVEEIFEGRRDIGFVGARIDRRGLRYDPIAEDEIVLAVPSHHPFAQEEAVSIQALANQRFVERESGSGTTMSLRRHLAERGLTLPPYRVAMTLSTTQAVVSAVRAGYGIGFVSSLALANEGRRGAAAVRLLEATLRRPLYLVRDERRLPPPVGRRFADFVLQRVVQGGSAAVEDTVRYKS